VRDIGERFIARRSLGYARDDGEAMFLTAGEGVRAEWQEGAKTLVGLERRAATGLGRRWQDGSAGTPVLSAACRAEGCFSWGAEIGGFVDSGRKCRCHRHSCGPRGCGLLWTPSPGLRFSPPAQRGEEGDRRAARGGEVVMRLVPRTSSVGQAPPHLPVAAQRGPSSPPLTRRRGRVSAWQRGQMKVSAVCAVSATALRGVSEVSEVSETPVRAVRRAA
jgi:hypothetical protein